MKILVFSSFLLVTKVFAASGGHDAGHDEHGVPTVVFWQAANILVLFGALFFLLRKKVVEFFAARRAQFVQEAAKSQLIQQEAEKNYLELSHKLDILTSTSQESIERARAQAADMKKDTIREAQEMAAKLLRDSKENMRLEWEKAKNQLRHKAMLTAVSDAKKLLQKDVGQTDHKNLQDKFATSIKEVSL
ncbi:MAG: ATP synthase F0 subunit B [Bdellovibrionota bacterium]